MWIQCAYKRTQADYNYFMPSIRPREILVINNPYEYDKVIHFLYILSDTVKIIDLNQLVEYNSHL